MAQQLPHAMTVQPPASHQLESNASPAAIENGRGTEFAAVAKPYVQFKLRLRVPLTHEGQKFDVISFREVDLEDVIFMQENGDGIESLKKIFGRMGNVPPEIFDKMPAREVGLILAFFTDCIKDFPSM